MAQVGFGPILVGVGYGLVRLACARESAGTAGLHILRGIFVSIAACAVCSTRTAVQRVHPGGALCFNQESADSPDAASFMPTGFDPSVLKAHKAEAVAVYAVSFGPLTYLPVLASSASGRARWSNALPLPRFVASPKWTALHYIQHRYVNTGMSPLFSCAISCSYASGSVGNLEGPFTFMCFQPLLSSPFYSLITI